MERLDVYLCGQLVGALVRDGLTLSFRYLPAYLSHADASPLGINDEFRGISGAGAQDKLIACLDEATGRISLPLHGTPSTHIIKPQLERFPESV